MILPRIRESFFDITRYVSLEDDCMSQRTLPERSVYSLSATIIACGRNLKQQTFSKLKSLICSFWKIKIFILNKFLYNIHDTKGFESIRESLRTLEWWETGGRETISLLVPAVQTQRLHAVQHGRHTRWRRSSSSCVLFWLIIKFT